MAWHAARAVVLGARAEWPTLLGQLVGIGVVVRPVSSRSSAVGALVIGSTSTFNTEAFVSCSVLDGVTAPVRVLFPWSGQHDVWIAVLAYAFTVHAAQSVWSLVGAGAAIDRACSALSDREEIEMSVASDAVVMHLAPLSLATSSRPGAVGCRAGVHRGRCLPLSASAVVFC